MIKENLFGRLEKKGAFGEYEKSSVA